VTQHKVSLLLRRQCLPHLPSDPFFPFSPLLADLRTEVQIALQQDKIQYLTNSVQHITDELNGVLGVLSSLNALQPPLFTSTQVPCDGIPLSTYANLAGLQAGASSRSSAGMSVPDQWAWGTGLSSSRSFLAGQSVDRFLAEKWHKYFPGRSPVLTPSHCLLTTSDFSPACSDQLIMPTCTAVKGSVNKIKNDNLIPGSAIGVRPCYSASRTVWPLTYAGVKLLKK